MVSSARRVIINYLKVNVGEMADWLEANNYKYAFVPYDDDPKSIGTLLMYVEVYSEEAETALRLKWECE